MEIEYEGGWYYIVVVTKIVMFGGNIVYAFHGNGQRIDSFIASPELSGFNVCTDLLLPKKEGVVKRIGKVDNTGNYLVSNLAKACNEYRHGHKAKMWWLYKISDPQNHTKKVKKLSKKQAMAMDLSTQSFDLVAKKIMSGYTPDQNPFILKRKSIWDLFS